VYVTDFSYNKIYVTTFEGVRFREALDYRIGGMSMPTQLDIRPGTVAPLSSVTSPPTLSAVAGELIELPLELRDSWNQPITSSFPDPKRFTVFAVGEIDVNGVMREVTFPQSVVVNENDEFFVHTSVTSAGSFKLHVKEGSGGMVENSLSNSTS